MKVLPVDSLVARELNRAMVFDLVRAQRVISRIGLARETGLSKATISEIVDQFIREGFVRTVGQGESSGGRRPTLLEFDPRARLTIGVELRDTSCTAVLCDLNAAPIRSLTAATRATSAEGAIAVAVDLIGELKSEIPADNLLGIGVGTPGSVDSRRGIIQAAPDVGWRDVPVGTQLGNRFALPVSVVNRAKAAALGEAWCGAGRDVDIIVYVSISTGIACGIVVRRRLYQGTAMADGYLGHFTVLPNGPLCYCGNRGCLEALAGSPAIMARIREELRSGRYSSPADVVGGWPALLTLEMVAEAAEAGDPLVLDVLGEAAAYLGIAVANLVNVLNPGMVILGGSVARAVPVLVPLIEAVVRRRAMSTLAAGLAVVSSQLGRDAVAVGAAAFLLGKVSVVGSAGLRPAVDPSLSAI